LAASTFGDADPPGFAGLIFRGGILASLLPLHADADTASPAATTNVTGRKARRIAITTSG
jgi:Na+/proline symporter